MTMDEIIRDIRLLAASKTGVSDELAEILYRHGCYDLLLRMPQDGEWKTQATRELMMHQFCLRERYKRCQPVWRALSRQGIPYAVVKGAVLSQAAYSSVNRRISGDVDMLIRREDADWLKAIFRECGFVQGRAEESGIVPFSRSEQVFYATASHQLAPFLCSTDNRLCPFVNADVNFDIFWGEHRKKTDMMRVLAETETAVICGVKLRKLKPEMEFIALCLHHYKDMNSLVLLYQKGLRLSLLCDLYFYWTNSGMDTEKLRTLGALLAATPYIYYCLFYTTLLFADEEMASVLPLFYSKKGAALLNRYGLKEEERREWPIGFVERLFTDNIRPHLETGFTNADWIKLKKNGLNL